jgi:HSP20 family protein
MLVRWSDPFENLFLNNKSFCSPFENLFSDFKKTWAPFVDVKEKKNQFIINVEIPGMDDKDIKITVDKNIMTIEGKKEIETRSKSFVRSFLLPALIDLEKIDASLDKGILTVNIPKISENTQRKIGIKINSSLKEQ